MAQGDEFSLGDRVLYHDPEHGWPTPLEAGEGKIAIIVEIGTGARAVRTRTFLDGHDLHLTDPPKRGEYHVVWAGGLGGVASVPAEHLTRLTGARVWIEAPLAWGPKQWLRTRLEQAGYEVRERRIIGRGEVVLEIR